MTMMYKCLKKSIVLISLITILITSMVNINVYANDNNDKILILYDTYKQYGGKNNELGYINDMAISTGNLVDIVNIKSYKDNSIYNYNKIIILCNLEGSIKGDLRENIKKFNGDIFWVGKNYDEFKSQKKLSHINLDDLNSSTEEKLFSAFGYINDFNKNRYILIDNVTPFIDLNDLVDKISYLYQNGIQFVISTIPVFENTNFNAMKRYAEVLRYAEARSGTIIMRNPYLENENAPAEDIISKCIIGYKNYLDYWVYPVALDIPKSYLYRDDMKPLLSKSNTIFLQETEDTGILDFSSFQNNKFRNVIQKINYENIDKNKYKDFENTAISIDNKISYKDFKNIVSNLIGNGIYFNNPSYIDSKVTLGNDVLTSGGSGIYLNDKPVTQNTFIDTKDFEGAVSKDNKDIEHQKEEENKYINISNPRKVLVVGAIIACIIFLVIVILSRRIDRKKYFK